MKHLLSTYYMFNNILDIFTYASNIILKISCEVATIIIAINRWGKQFKKINLSKVTQHSRFEIQPQGV